MSLPHEWDIRGGKDLSGVGGASPLFTLQSQECMNINNINLNIFRVILQRVGEEFSRRGRKKKDDLNWEGGEFKVRNIVSFSFTVESFKPPMKTLETAFSFQSCGGGFRSRSFPMHATCWSQKCH